MPESSEMQHPAEYDGEEDRQKTGIRPRIVKGAGEGVLAVQRWKKTIDLSQSDEYFGQPCRSQRIHGKTTEFPVGGKGPEQQPPDQPLAREQQLDRLGVQPPPVRGQEQHRQAQYRDVHRLEPQRIPGAAGSRQQDRAGQQGTAGRNAVQQRDFADHHALPGIGIYGEDRAQQGGQHQVWYRLQPSGMVPCRRGRLHGLWCVSHRQNASFFKHLFQLMRPVAGLYDQLMRVMTPTTKSSGTKPQYRLSLESVTWSPPAK